MDAFKVLDEAVAEVAAKLFGLLGSEHYVNITLRDSNDRLVERASRRIHDK